MARTNHRLDHILKSVKSEDLIWHMQSYDVDLLSNHIYLFGREEFTSGQEEAIGEPGVEYTMANRFIKNMNLLMRVNPDKPILVHMKTCGGDWTEGMAIYNMIKSCPSPVTILNYTHARSMSSLIFQAAERRIMMPDSYFMFHDGTLSNEGTVKQVQSDLNFSKTQEKRMLSVYVTEMKQKGIYKDWSEERIHRMLRRRMDREEDVFLTAEQTVEWGLADAIFDYDWAKLANFEG